jgi:parallel beta-helix repeat protein
MRHHWYILVLFLFILSSFPAQPTTAIKSQDCGVFLAYYTEHNPITINLNQDFRDLGLSGTGAIDEPYIIEGLYIEVTGSENFGIEIQGTTAHFIIRDCHIISEFVGIGIFDLRAGIAQIINNTCISSSGDGGGIGIGSSRGCKIIENRCTNFMQGIHLNHADNCDIIGNNFTDNNYQGINIRYSDGSTITGNLVRNNSQHGLAFVGTAEDNVVHSNTFIDNGDVETYRIDGERTGPLTSQGYDEGTNNTWYDIEAERGNWWSDYSGSGSYIIDGPSESIDLYPNRNETPTDPVTPDLIQIMIIVSGTGIILVLVIVLFIRKRRYS